jgi:glycogen synthase
MNIAVLPSAYRPNIGGVEELSRQLGLAYVRKGHNVAIVTNRWPRDLPEEEVLDGLPVYRPPFRLPHRSIRGKVSYPLTNRRVSNKLNAIVHRHQIDILHVQCVSSNCHYALRARQELGIPVVVTTQGELTMDTAQSFQRQPMMASLMRRGTEEADLVTACSAKTLADLEAFVGHSLPKAQVIHNGADVGGFADASPLRIEYPYVLSIGRIVPQKGFDTLLRAWAMISDPNTRLIIAGDGPELENLEELARDLNIRESMEFFGPADRETVPRLFAGATAVVVPSLADEGLPLVSIEAMASGRPLVVTRSGGIAEVVTDGENGLIVERGDQQGIARALQRILDNGELAASLGRAAQQRAWAFDWNTLADRYLDGFSAVKREQER